MSLPHQIVRCLLDAEDEKAEDIDLGDFVKGSLGFSSFMSSRPAEDGPPVPGRRYYAWDHQYGNVAVLILRAYHFTTGNHAPGAYVEMEYHDLRYGLPPAKTAFNVYELDASKMVNLVKGLHKKIDEITAFVGPLEGKDFTLEEAQKVWEDVRYVFTMAVQALSTVVSQKMRQHQR